jgi:CRP/FNR family transcriptional regulator, cyclic AMP receptor protein
MNYQESMESAVQRNWLTSVERPERLFCDLSPEAAQAFDALKTVAACPRGALLFREGQPARGIFVLCNGRARLSVSSESGKRMTLRIAGPGEILGLSAALAGSPHEVTAELLDDAHVAAVRRKDLLRFLHEHREACLQVVNLLSQDLHVAYDRVRSLGLGRSRRPRAPRVQ